MTLQQFFDVLSANPMIVLFYFIALPLSAFLSGVMSKGTGHLSPWKYVYCVLLYMAAVPGVFAVFLNVYFFLFERQSLLDTNLFTQIIPIVAMFATFLIIRRNVDLRAIPGFDRITGMIVIIAAVIGAMWILDRTRIIAITFLPFQYVFLIIIGLLVAIRYGWRQTFVKP